jgi:phospholipase C
VSTSSERALYIGLAALLAGACGREDIELLPGEPAHASSCPAPVAADPLAGRRAQCTFTRGAMPQNTITISPRDRGSIPIGHVVVMIKENRSFDHLLGQLSTEGQPDADAIPLAYSNKAGPPVHAITTCIHTDPPHRWDDMHAYVDGGKMDGFPSVALSYYGPAELPFYYWFANTFAVADRYFASALSGSMPNRTFSLLATSGGMLNNGDPAPPPTTPSILSELDAKGVTWGAYTDRTPFDDALGSDWPGVSAHAHSHADFMAAAKDGTLPSVAWVDSIPDVEDEHPTADVQIGEAWTREMYEALATGPLWPSTVLLWTYDEAGGFLDHVAPPKTCPPQDGTPNEGMFFELGIRVPLVVASPWARRHYVSHVVHEHTSILRFIETLFDLPALTARDANSDALLDMFDFTCGDMSPIPASPPAGTGGCR